MASNGPFQPKAFYDGMVSRNKKARLLHKADCCRLGWSCTSKELLVPSREGTGSADLAGAALAVAWRMMFVDDLSLLTKARTNEKHPPTLSFYSTVVE